MFHLKRFFCGVLIGMILAASIPVYAVFEDVQETGSKEAVETVVALGVMKVYEDGTFKPDNVVTRGEFAGILVSMLGLAESVVDNKAQGLFDDVKADHPEAASIELAAKCGIISGYGNGSFGPDDPVTYEQAVKTILTVLGYDAYAQERGGYPAGYLWAASEKGITDKIDSAAETTVKRSAMAQMLFNAFDIEIMEQTGFGESKNFVVEKDKTILSDKMDIIKESGELIATSDTRLSSDSSLQDDEVEIEGNVYKVGSSKAKEYLGYNVTFYAKKEKGEDKGTIMYIKPQPGKNSVLRIHAEDLIVNDSSYSLKSIVYRDSRQEIEKVKLSQNMDVVYNGKAYFGYTLDTLKPLMGTVTLLSNDGDQVYDVVFVNEYDNYIVESIDISNKTVYDKYGKTPIVLDQGDIEKKLTIIDSKGQPVEFSSIKPWNVLSIEKSLDESVIKAVVSTESVTGIILESGYENDIQELAIGDKKYKVALSYSQYTGTDKKTLEVDGEYIYYLDAEGKIAGVDENAANATNYAYLIKAQSKRGIGDKVDFKMFGDNGVWIYATSADKVTFNKNRTQSQYFTGKQLLSRDEFNDSSKKFKPQLVTYKLNEQGELIEMNTAINAVNGYDEENFSMDYNLVSAKYKSAAKTFNALYAVEAKTKIFVVPQPDSNGDYEEDQFFAVPSSYLMGDGLYNLTVYDSNAAKVANAIILTNISNVYKELNYNMLMVKNVTTVIEENEKRCKLYGLYQGKEVSYFAVDDQMIQNLNEGDVVQVSLDPTGKIKRIYLRWQASSPGSFTEAGLAGSASDMMAELATVYGIAYAKSGAVISVSVNNGVTLRPCVSTNSTKFYVYDRAKPKGKRLAAATMAEVICKGKNSYNEGSKVFVNMRYTAITDIVIIK